MKLCLIASLMCLVSASDAYTLIKRNDMRLNQVHNLIKASKNKDQKQQNQKKPDTVVPIAPIADVKKGDTKILSLKDNSNIVINVQLTSTKTAKLLVHFQPDMKGFDYKLIGDDDRLI